MRGGVLLDKATGRPVSNRAAQPPLLDPDVLDFLRRDGRQHYIDSFNRIKDSGDPFAADDIFFHDTRAPFTVADVGTVTMSTTDKALYPVDNFPVLGGQYFKFLGKKMGIRMFGKITTAATPGNLTFDVYWGSGADANGTVIQSSAAQTLVASQTNLSWELFIVITCTALGSTAGALKVSGNAFFNTSVIAAGKFLLPASALAAVGSLNLTTASIISVQAKRSGSTAETMTVQEMEVISLN